MRILAVFTGKEAETGLKLLRKSEHYLHVVETASQALQSLSRTPFDLILCQPATETETCFDLLKTIRSGNTATQIPFICCHLSESGIESEMKVHINSMVSTLGKQGYIGSKTFNSRK